MCTDRKVTGAKCLDTAPAFEGDAEYPYVGDYVKNLTLDQVRTLDCGTFAQAAFPGRETHPGAPMPLLGEVFDLVDVLREVMADHGFKLSKRYCDR